MLERRCPLPSGEDHQVDLLHHRRYVAEAVDETDGGDERREVVGGRLRTRSHGGDSTENVTYDGR